MKDVFQVKNFRFRQLWIGIGILILLSPIGLFLPKTFRAGAVWGEWGIDEIERIIGYAPEGLKKLSELWKAPIHDYSFWGWDEGIKSHLGYILSGIIGVAIVFGIAVLIGKVLARKNGNP